MRYVYAYITVGLSYFVYVYADLAVTSIPERVLSIR